METDKMKKNDITEVTASGRRLSSVVCHLAVALATILLTATANAQDTVEWTESWDGGGMSSWTGGTADVTLSNPSDYLNMSFKSQTSPESVSCIAKTDLVRVDGFQHPTNQLQLMTNMSFTFYAEDTVPSSLRLYFGTTGGRAWHLNLQREPTEQLVSYSIPIEFAEGWSVGPATTEAMFDSDMQNVEWVGVYVRRGGATIAQNYRLDDFVIQGVILIDPDQDTDGDKIPDVWEIANDMDPDDPDDAQDDDDGDNMSNFAEYWAGTDIKDSNSRFTLKISKNNGEPADVGILIRWNSIEGRTYAVWRSTNLIEGFSPYYTGMPADPPVNVFRDDTATNNNPYFYKVKVEE